MFKNQALLRYNPLFRSTIDFWALSSTQYLTRPRLTMTWMIAIETYSEIMIFTFFALTVEIPITGVPFSVIIRYSPEP